MKRASLQRWVVFAVAIAAVAGTAAMAAQSEDREGNRGRNRGVIVLDDPFFIGPVDTWGTYPSPMYPVPYASNHGYVSAMRKGLVPVELHVHPWKASVMVDHSALGQARDYNDDSHPLWLSPGKHTVELQYPGYETYEFQLDLDKGVPHNLHYRLTKGTGVDPRSGAAIVPEVTDEHRPS